MIRSQKARLSSPALKRYFLLPFWLLRLINFFFFPSYFLLWSHIVPRRIFVYLATFILIYPRAQFPFRTLPPSSNPVCLRAHVSFRDLEWMDGEQLLRVQLSRHKLPWPDVVWVWTFLEPSPTPLIKSTIRACRFFSLLVLHCLLFHRVVAPWKWNPAVIALSSSRWNVNFFCVYSWWVMEWWNLSLRIASFKCEFPS